MREPRIVLLVIIGLLAADGASAGSVYVTTENPRTGSHHARVEVGRSCSTDHLDVDTVDGRVTLNGKVRTERQREEAEEVARGTEGVVEVVNLLEVAPRGG